MTRVKEARTAFLVFKIDKSTAKINYTQINSTTARRHDGMHDDWSRQISERGTAVRGEPGYRTGLVGQYETALVVSGHGIRTLYLLCSRSGWARSGYMHAVNRDSEFSYQYSRMSI